MVVITNSLAISPKTSAVISIKGHICTTGGFVGSSEDKIAIPTSEKLYVLSFSLSLHDDRFKMAIAREVDFTTRCSLRVELDSECISKGSGVDDEIKFSLKENANRSLLFTAEQINRDSLNLRNGARLVAWSPRGVDKYERCIMSLTTMENRSILCTFKETESWEESVDLSLIWQQYYVQHGRIAQSRKSIVDSRPQFVFQPTECDNISPLICKNIVDYFDAVEDVVVVYTSWCQIIRQPQIKSTNSMNLKTETYVDNNTSYYTIPVDPSQFATESFSLCPVTFFAVLMKSGAFCIWMISVPFSGVSSMSLLWVDYTYAVVRSDSMDKRPNYIKLYDLDSVNLLLVLGFTDGSVKGLVFPIEYSPTGILVLTIPYLFNLWTTPLYYVTILASAWSMSRRLLCVGYGRHLLLFHIAKEDVAINFQQQEQSNSLPTPCRGRDPLYLVKSQFVSQPNPILGYITGIHLDNKQILLTSVDGYLMRASLDEVSECKLNWQIIWCSSNYEKSDLIHWEFHGLSVSTNGVYVCFLEKPCNYLDNNRARHCALFSPRVHFLSFWSNDNLLEVIFNPELPLHRKIDCLQELLQRWHLPQDKIDNDTINLKQICLEKIDFYQTCLTDCSSFPKSWLDKSLTTLQIYRFILCMINKDTDESIKSRAQLWLTNLDQFIQQRHLERCFRLFLKCSIQRQARDCLLVSQMATLTLNIFQPIKSSSSSSQRLMNTSKSSVDNDNDTKHMITMSNKTICFVKDLYDLAKNVHQLAVQLYVHRFKLSHETINNSSEKCPICLESIIPDLTYLNCAQNHPFKRCMQSLEPCIDPMFRHCNQCDRIALSISPQDRSSVWRSKILHPMCTYCDLPLTWKEF
ncbi:unnamed protein product [Schistosoma turkestanicum]|nr:unnamed protein product [Schistosoma turkestanicum]